MNHSTADPVCVAIESLLRDYEKRGEARLEVEHRGNAVALVFDDVRAEGHTREIALVRLASEMVEHPRYGEALRATLRPHR